MEGRCQCGAVKFRTPNDKPVKWFICHCLECRRQSASAFGISAIFPNFDLLAQNPGAGTGPGTGSADSTNDANSYENDLIGTYTHSNTTSGRAKRCYFCKKCGTRIMNLSVVPGNGAGGWVAVKGGCLEGIRGDVWTSATHIWTKSALVGIPEGVEQYEGDPPPRQ
ncbi:hypothetical protein A1O7_08882 [Cladophialophora yegresii CBS 114405]|uniref:CENP-V/GFA domain-containing protein n=1 Tax=Cladophialophora yegresii CBS 114405 TaxID=1182544 RepID=W9VUX2_9EURO|nr:uncharacterized protein A1O7_08882 [Cladophialophora yegresii CBS 114405]EXJ55951.1 hypothetical protein A1O7_08882 [Cladophialophora yegresii CBS 114405]